MNKKILFCVVVIFIFACMLCVQAQEKNVQLEKPKSMDNIQVEIKFVIVEKGKDEVTHEYKFNIQAGENFEFDIGSSSPASSKKPATKESDTTTPKAENYFSEGFKGNFYTVMDGKKVILHSNIDFSQVILSENSKIPVPRKLSLKITSVHEDSDFIKVFTGDFVEPKQSISVEIKVDAGKKR